MLVIIKSSGAKIIAPAQDKNGCGRRQPRKLMSRTSTPMVYVNAKRTVDFFD